MLASAPSCAKMKKTNKQKQSTKKEQKDNKIVNICLCTFLCQNGRREDDSTSFGENTICPDIDKERGRLKYIYLIYLLLKLVIDSCLFKHTYMCWEESESVMKKTHLVGNELEEWPMSSFYDRGC